MAQSPRGTPWFAPLLLSRLVTTGSTAVVTAGLRAGARSLRLCLGRSPTLLRLAVESSTSSDRAAAAQAGLRDELLGLARDFAGLSWHEARRALDDLDAGTRVKEPASAAGRRRRARVKP
jgi:hypothetical protein